MAKDRERRLAEDLYIKQRKTAKEIAVLVNVTEKTIGDWVAKYGWKERRSEAISNVKSGIENLNQLINIYTEKAITLESKEQEIKDLPKAEQNIARGFIIKEKVGLIDAIAKLNKTKENFEKEHRIPYNVYINVTEQIMSEMLDKIPAKLQPKILDFFEEHINEIALKYR